MLSSPQPPVTFALIGRNLLRRILFSDVSVCFLLLGRALIWKETVVCRFYEPTHNVTEGNTHHRKIIPLCNT
jgi:hypothetical protein